MKHDTYGPLDMDSRSDEDVCHDACPGHTVHHADARGGQKFETNTHPEGLDDGVDEHGSKISGPKPG